MAQKSAPNAPWSEQLTFSSESSSVWSVSTNAAGWRNCNRRWIEQVKMINSRLLQFYNVGQCVTIQAAAGATGYGLQYLMRLPRAEKITGVKIGQVWLIEFDSLEAYLKLKTDSVDKHCGPKNFRMEHTNDII